MAVASNAISAKARAMFGKRITDEQYKDLICCESVSAVAAYLKAHTDYARLLEGVGGDCVHRGQLESILKSRIFEISASLCRYDSGFQENFSSYIVTKSEISQILRFLRLLISGRAGEYRLSLPRGLSEHTSLDLIELSRVQDARGFFSVMSKTKYAKTLAPFAVSSGEIDFTGIENALYKYTYAKLWNMIEKNTRGTEKTEFKDLIGSHIDVFNFVHIYRLKRYFNASDDFLRSTVFPHYYKLSKDVIEQMITAENSEQVIKIFSSTYYKKDWEEIDFLYADGFGNRLHYKKSKKLIYYSTNPSVVMMAYINLIGTECNNIIKIIEGVRYKVPPDEIKKLIIN